MKDIIVHTSDISKDVDFEWEKKNLEFFKSAREYEFPHEDIKELHKEYWIIMFYLRTCYRQEMSRKVHEEKYSDCL